MEYHFIRQDIYSDPVIFVLSYYKRTLRERILIGTEMGIKDHLCGILDTEVYYDAIRPLGSLLMDNKQDENNDWTEKGFMPLWKALHTNRWKQPALEKAASDFCTKMYKTGYPLSMYAAIRLWNGYLRARMPRDRDLAAEAFRTDIMKLLRPLSEYPPELLCDRSCMERIRQTEDDLKLNIWYPRKTDIECVTAYGSFLPVFLYYHSRLSDNKRYFRTCKVCGRIFLAPSLKYEICSDKCRSRNKTQAKRDFDERGRENEYDHIYKNETQRWLHYIHRMERNPDCTPERLAEIRAAYENFKAEAKKRKTAVKNGQSSLIEYRSWIVREPERFT